MDNNQVHAIDEMLKEQKSEDLLKKSFGMFFDINRENIISRIAIVSIGVILAVGIIQGNAVITMCEVSSIMLDVVLAIFGTIFTGYALFQALLNGKLVFILMQDVMLDKQKNIYHNTLGKTNLSFVQLMLQFIVSIFVNLFLKIVLNIIPHEFCLFGKIWINELVVFALLLIYFYHTMVILWRMVSFLFNMYQLFNSYAVSKYNSYVCNKSEDE